MSGNMITSLYPMPLRVIVDKTVTARMIVTLFPMPIRIITQKEVTARMIYTEYPMHVQCLPIPEIPYPLPPSIDNIIDLNDGKEGFAASYDNTHYVSYSSENGNPSDIIGNSSIDTINWTPKQNNTDPPSHFILTIKDLKYGCAFFPAFDKFKNLFAIAWIENNIIGKLNLKYGESLVTGNIQTPPTTGYIGTNTVYVRPNKTSIRDNEVLQNVPLSDIYITDVNNNTFDLNVYHQNNTVFGHEITLQNVIKSVSFVQSFKNKAILKCKITTAPSAGTVTTDYVSALPLSNITVNVYYGTTKLLYGTYLSDNHGKFDVPVVYGDFLFEIMVTNPSIQLSQIFL